MNPRKKIRGYIRSLPDNDGPKIPFWKFVWIWIAGPMLQANKGWKSPERES